jgi:ComF family protein
MANASFWNKMFNYLVAAIFPRNCVGCGEALQGAAQVYEWEYLCKECAVNLRSVGEEACRRCGVPVYGSMSGERLCSVCREKPPVWNESRSFLRYAGPARGWVRSYKYRDARYVEREWRKLFGAASYAHLRDWLAGAVLVPVPLHPFKRLMRGFNQSENLARLVLGVLKPAGAQVNACLIRRIKWTRQQARLGRDKRLKNMKGAFAVDKKALAPELLKGRVVLVDDLLTTGATLSACAAALKKAGFGQIDVLTLCRG